jgi:hypothetical protein
MSSLTKQKLSSSTDGKPIKVVATATAGTAVHTADATAWDEVWLWAFNSDTVLRTLTIEFGGATAPDQNIVVDIPPKSGLLLVVPGLILTNSATVKAFASSANVVTVSGYVNRIVN